MADIMSIIQKDPGLQSFFASCDYYGVAQCFVKRFEEKEIVVRAEDKIEFCYLVFSGQMSVYNEFINGRSYIVDKIDSGAIIGEMELCGGESHFISTVSAFSKCETLVFGKALYHEWFHSYAKFSVDATKRLGHMLCVLSKTNGENIVYPSETAVALFLVRAYEQNGGDVLFRDTRQMLADRLGMSLRTLNRVIYHFEKHGRIKLIKGKIFVGSLEYHKLLLVL